MLTVSRLVRVPFTGFYRGEHDDAVNRIRNWGGVKHAQFYWDYSREYVKRYSRAFKKEVGVDLHLVFDEVDMPSEYNLLTDRIFANGENFEKVSTFRMDECARRMFTSRDGFCSHYEPNWRTWGELIGWDHNQLYCLIRSVFTPQYLMGDRLVREIARRNREE